MIDYEAKYRERNRRDVEWAYREVAHYAKPVTCELCSQQLHTQCVRPCICRHGRQS